MHYVLGVDNNNIYSLDIVIDIENKMTFVYIVAASVGSHCQSSPGLYRAAVVHCWVCVFCDKVSVVLWRTSDLCLHKGCTLLPSWTVGSACAVTRWMLYCGGPVTCVFTRVVLCYRRAVLIWRVLWQRECCIVADQWGRVAVQRPVDAASDHSSDWLSVAHTCQHQYISFCVRSVTPICLCNKCKAVLYIILSLRFNGNFSR